MTMIKNLSAVTNRIEKAEKQSNRAPKSVQLLAVSKTWPADKITELAAVGQRHFGENYLQEAIQKITTLSDLNLIWHFIGPIQSNKTKDIAQHFDWAQSVDRLKIARRLNEQRPIDKPPLNICIQINIDNEQTKSGIGVDELIPLANDIAKLPQLKLRGIMVIPTKTDDPKRQRTAFEKAVNCFQNLQNQYPDVDTLSMGMSSDLDIAIEQGSTLVRVGTALFGQRTTPTTSGQVK